MTLIHTLSDSDDSELESLRDSPPRKKPRLSQLPTVTVHIIQQKLPDSDIEELYSLVDKCDNEALSLKLTPSIEEAKVIVTTLRMRRRLERHLDWELASQKAIVTPDWIRACYEKQSVAPYASFAAIKELQDSQPSAWESPSQPLESAEVPIYDWKDYDHTSGYACMRASPLVCPNQELARQLAVVSRERKLEGNDVSSLSYARAVAVRYLFTFIAEQAADAPSRQLKVLCHYPQVLELCRIDPRPAFPHELTNRNLREFQQLTFVGPKTSSKVAEFVQKGFITETMKIESSSRYTSLNTFTQVHGIGPTTARSLYTDGLRTLEDLRRYYSSSHAERSHQTRDLPTLTTADALALHEDLQQKIPRSEVEEIHACIKHEMEGILKGCHTVVCGGYRRGKPYSNDLDIVIGHPEFSSSTEREQELASQFLLGLHMKGIITHCFKQSVQFHNTKPKRTWTPPNTLDVVLTIFKLPNSTVHRQVDFIFVLDPKAFWTAVVGWTGSMMFERDIRRWAKEKKGLKFDSRGITRRRDSHVFAPKSEKEVFDILGLQWIHPTLRNADI
ncbi:hypothetical protein DL96DRAFT_1701904 [Flagelloscypha sp. PMI_526]|nr:hypothetical protein DL96DRAFT_1701904 [Flagelloscypha sp. PMI_526]